MSSPNPIAPTNEAITGALRIVNSQRLQDAAPCVATLAPPPQAPLARSDERLFILLDAAGTVSTHRYRELREATAQTYWAASGSITAALRLAAGAANRRLYQVNSRAAPADQCHGSLVCAVLRGAELFVLQAGPAGACLFHQGRLRYFVLGDEIAPLGTGQLPDTRIHHTYVAPGDKLLLASLSLMRTIGDEGLVRVLARAEVNEALDGLEQVGAGADFSALIARWPLPGETLVTHEIAQPTSRFSLRRPGGKKAPPKRETPRLFSRLRTAPKSDRDEPAPIPIEPSVQVAEPYEPPPPEPSKVERVTPIPVEPPIQAAEPHEPLWPEPAKVEPVMPIPVAPPIQAVEPYEPPLPEFAVEEDEQETMPVEREPEREPGPDLGERVGNIARSAGRGFGAAAGLVAGGASSLLRRVMPGSGKATRRRTRSLPPPHQSSRAARPIPQEDRATMMALAVGIPIVLLVIVALAYRMFGTDARFRDLIRQAEEKVSLAQAAGSTAEPSRPHWEAALEHAAAAAELRPDDQVAAALQAQAQAALDSIDGIVRLQPILLAEFGPGIVSRRLAVHGQMIFVLDPANGWVSRLTLNQAGNGVIEPGAITIVQKEQSIGDGMVGDLVDLVWVDLASGRQTSGLLMLEQDGALVSYDPTWEGAGGTLQLQRSFLGQPPELPKIVGTYEGRFYILDTDLNQIRRYEPSGDTYPERPDHYFVVQPPRPLADVLDMAIDGRIYLLHADGVILKFLRGDPDPFDVRGLPGDLSQAVALAVDPDSSSGVIYVADRGGVPETGRVVALEPDGEFRVQYYGGGAFDMLEAVAVDEAVRRIYVISGGRLYVASLP